MRGREGQGVRRDREGMGGRRAVQYQLFALPAADSFIKITRSSLASFYLCYLIKRGLHRQICVEMLETLAVWLATNGRQARCSDTQFRRQAGLCPRSRR